MDDEHLRYPIGSKEHYAAYEKEFSTYDGIGYPFRDDPEGSYEVDYAYELALDRYAEAGGPDEGDLEEDDPDSSADRDDAELPTFRREDPEPGPEPWLFRAPVRPVGPA